MVIVSSSVSSSPIRASESVDVWSLAWSDVFSGQSLVDPVECGSSFAVVSRPSLPSTEFAMIQYRSSVLPLFGPGLVISMIGGAGMAERFVGSNRVVWLARSLSKAGTPIFEFVDGSCSKRSVARNCCCEWIVRSEIKSDGNIWEV